jgi:hypothetical protein
MNPHLQSKRCRNIEINLVINSRMLHKDENSYY